MGGQLRNGALRAREDMAVRICTHIHPPTHTINNLWIFTRGNDQVDLAGVFLAHGANLEARHPVSGHTPLSSAVERGHAEYVAFLLRHGATIHHTDPPETNPVAIARRLGFKEIDALLTNPPERRP